jgi:hypothetical protein
VASTACDIDRPSPTGYWLLARERLKHAALGLADRQKRIGRTWIDLCGLPLQRKDAGSDANLHPALAELGVKSSRALVEPQRSPNARRRMNTSRPI